MRSINPATGELIADYPDDSVDTIEQKIASTHEAFKEWSLTSFKQRSELLKNVAQELRQGISPYARRITDEMGKTIAQSRAEIEKCAWVCDYFADNGARFMEPEAVDTQAHQSFISFEPMGSILAIMPWNFPFWQVFRFAAPTLMAGNTVLLKHAPNVSGCAHAIAEIFQNAGFPQSVFTTLDMPVKRVADVIRDPLVVGVTLTGSVAAGQAVGSLAGESIKKCVLELGGSDPFIVLADADIDAAVHSAITSRMLTNGQTCIAAKRFIIEQPIYEQFVERLYDAMNQLVMGDPLDEKTDIGPLAREDIRDTLHRQVKKTIKRGAQCILGGSIPDSPGYFYPPTLLVDVDETMVAFQEELFGPVAAIIPAETPEHAIILANNSDYGLGASIWTTRTRGLEIAPQLNVGAVAINDIVKSDPRLPFGGTKKSGIGRELSRYGMLEFVNIKTTWVA